MHRHHRHPVGFDKPRRLQRRCVPRPARNEVGQLIVADAFACRHRLDALAITRAEHPGNIGRAHPRPRLVPERRDKRREPTLQIVAPVPTHGRVLLGRPPVNHADQTLGTPKSTHHPKYAKVVLGCRNRPHGLFFI